LRQREKRAFRHACKEGKKNQSSAKRAAANLSEKKKTRKRWVSSRWQETSIRTGKNFTEIKIGEIEVRHKTFKCEEEMIARPSVEKKKLSLRQVCLWGKSPYVSTKGHGNKEGGTREGTK